ncbi:MAG: helix-turn-helix transcriptional regulator, partial [Planctomycetes bacterium]|nr:helix-turn-helix transcriptional regulator [Planctomycetota bacterium]
HFAPRPGSVYRALKQLAKWRWVVEARYDRLHARPAGWYFITETGLQALRTWALETPTRTEAVHDPAAALARFYFLEPIAEPGEACVWLEAFERHLGEHLNMVRMFERCTNDIPAVRDLKATRKWLAHAPDWEVHSRHGNLALDAPHALHSGLLQWARRARSELAEDLARARSAQAEEEHFAHVQAQRTTTF